MSWSRVLRGHRPCWPVATWKRFPGEEGVNVLLAPSEIVLVLHSETRDGSELPRSLSLTFASLDGAVCVEARIPNPVVFLEDVTEAVRWQATGEVKPLEALCAEA